MSVFFIKGNGGGNFAYISYSGRLYSRDDNSPHLAFPGKRRTKPIKRCKFYCSPRLDIFFGIHTDGKRRPKRAPTPLISIRISNFQYGHVERSCSSQTTFWFIAIGYIEDFPDSIFFRRKLIRFRWQIFDFFKIKYSILLYVEKVKIKRLQF